MDEEPNHTIARKTGPLHPHVSSVVRGDLAGQARQYFVPLNPLPFAHCLFRAQKSLDCQGPHLPMALVMDARRYIKKLTAICLSHKIRLRYIKCLPVCFATSILLSLSLKLTQFHTFFSFLCMEDRQIPLHIFS